MAPYYFPVLKFQLQAGYFAVMFGTADFTTTNRACRPGWKPRASFQDYGSVCESRYHWRLDWLFHLDVFWGKPNER